MVACNHTTASDALTQQEIAGRQREEIQNKYEKVVSSRDGTLRALEDAHRQELADIDEKVYSRTFFLSLARSLNLVPFFASIFLTGSYYLRYVELCRRKTRHVGD